MRSSCLSLGCAVGFGSVFKQGTAFPQVLQILLGALLLLIAFIVSIKSIFFSKVFLTYAYLVLFVFWKPPLINSLLGLLSLSLSLCFWLCVSPCGFHSPVTLQQVRHHGTEVEVDTDERRRASASRPNWKLSFVCNVAKMLASVTWRGCAHDLQTSGGKSPPIRWLLLSVLTV